MTPVRCTLCRHPVKRWRLPHVEYTARRWAHFLCFIRDGLIPLAEIRQLGGRERRRG